MANTRGKRKETNLVDEVMDKVDETKPVIESETKPKSFNKEGVVYNCGNLNIRKAPSKGASVLKVIAKGTKVEILKEVNDEWYKVLVDGIGTGFCMKEFIR